MSGLNPPAECGCAGRHVIATFAMSQLGIARPSLLGTANDANAV
jgi:hypothetical protein